MSRWRLLRVAALVPLLWPVWAFTRYALDFVPGAGPQGGEAVMVLALMYWMLWQLIAALHWARLKRRRIGTGWQRLGVALAPTLALTLTILWVEAEGPPLPAGLLVLLMLGGSQLWAQWRLAGGAGL